VIISPGERYPATTDDRRKCIPSATVWVVAGFTTIEEDLVRLLLLRVTELILTSAWFLAWAPAVFINIMPATINNVPGFIIDCFK
jgi:hypothetical protein